MRNHLCTLTLATLLACDGNQPGTDTTDATAPVESAETGTTLLDSSWPVGDIGNLHIARHVNTGRTDVAGLFLDGSAGYLNMAQCTVGRDAACVGGIPAQEETPEDVDRDQEVDPEVVDSRFLGFEIEFGPYKLPYAEDRRSGLGYYRLDATDLEPAEGSIGVTWGGQWDKRKTRNDLEVSPPIALLSPRIGSNLFVPNGTRLPIEWVPTGKGEVTLTVATRFTLFRFFRLDDDGYFELDVDSLGLTGQLEDLTVTIARWDISEVNANGHFARLVASSDAFFTMDLANVGAREETFPTDSCTEASGMQPLATGDYWGRLDGFGNDLDPGFNSPCLNATGNYLGAGRGRDGLLKVELSPKSIVNLQYNHFTESGSVYFVSDCDNVASCEAGIDADISPGAPETLSLTNLSDDLETHYLVLDSTADDEPTSEVFTLDVTIENLLDPEMFDFCTDAVAANPTLTTAGYYEEFVAYTGDLNPGIGGCTLTSTPGPEAVIPFTLQPGQTITAGLAMEGGNGALYVLTGCETSSCVAGADTQGVGDPESLILTNTSAAAQDLNLVVDSQVSGLRPFLLSIAFN